MGHPDTTVRPVRSEELHRPGAVRVLEGRRGSAARRVFTLDRAQTTLGKSDDATIVLPDSGVSRVHAKIVVATDGGVSILDLASTNGTYVNGTRIDRATLRRDDEIALGPEAVLRLAVRSARDGKSLPSRGLSRRQLEVARRVASGSTNAEVAQLLGISPRTVTSHLDQIYNRLGIGSRAALTRWIVESDLLQDCDDEPGDSSGST